MSRFFNEEEFPDDYFPGTDDQEEQEFIIGADEQFLRSLELDERELNSKILFRTIRSLEKSWFWRFRSQNQKLKMIKQAYIFYYELLTGNIPDDPEEMQQLDAEEQTNAEDVEV